MKAIKFLLNIFKSNKMERIQLLLLVLAHYATGVEKNNEISKKRHEFFEGELEKELSKLYPNMLEKIEKEAKVEEKPKVEPKQETKVESKPETVAAVGPVPTKQLAQEAVKATAPAVIEKKEELPPKEAVVEVKPFYSYKVEVERNGKKELREIELKFEHAKVNLPAFEDATVAKQFRDVYPTVEKLDEVLDEAWDMIDMGFSNKEINKELHKELSKYYAKSGFATEDDFYKITNGLYKLYRVIRRSFGYNYEDKSISVSRPSYTRYLEDNKDIVMKREFDCTPKKEEEIKEETPAPETKKEPEMKTVQKATTEVPVEKEEPAKVEDEETQETAPVDQESSVEQEESAVEESTEKVTEESTDSTKAPKVPHFDEFNDVEKLVYEKLKNANVKASKEKDPSKASAIKSEAKVDAKLLIQSFYDGQEWAEIDGETGRFKSEFVRYWNDIIKEIGTRANVR